MPASSLRRGRRAAAPLTRRALSAVRGVRLPAGGATSATAWPAARAPVRAARTWSACSRSAVDRAHAERRPARRIAPAARRAPPPAPPAHAAASALRAAPGCPCCGRPRPASRRCSCSCFLGFGVLLGDGRGHARRRHAVGRRSPLKLVLPASHARGTAPAPTPILAANRARPANRPPPNLNRLPQAAAATTAAAAKPSAERRREGSGSGIRLGRSRSSAVGTSSAAQPATKLPPIKHVFVIMLSDEPYASVVRTGLDGPLPVQDAGAARASCSSTTTRSRTRSSPTAWRCSAGRGRRRKPPPTAPPTPTSRRRRRRLRTGARQRLRVPAVHADAGRPARSPSTSPGGPTCRASTKPGAPGGRVRASRPRGRPTRRPRRRRAAGAYATFRNPFVYFHSILDSSACAADDVGLSALKGDLAQRHAHAELLLHRPRPLPRRQPDAVHARGARGAGARRTRS